MLLDVDERMGGKKEKLFKVFLFFTLPAIRMRKFIYNTSLKTQCGLALLIAKCILVMLR